MPYEREGRVLEFTDVTTLLEEEASLFSGVVIEAENPSGVRVMVEHASQGLEPMFTMGEAKRTNGESREELVFNALKDATNTPDHLAGFMGYQDLPEQGVEVFLLDTFGTPLRSQGATFEDASLQGLRAIHTLQTQ